MSRLYNNTVSEDLLTLCKQLQALKGFENAYLVGGTSIALRMGYRKSIDIDLFFTDNPNITTVKYILENNTDFTTLSQREGTIIGQINNIKIDCIDYPYESIRPTETIEGIRMLSLEDVAAMKLSAILNSGKRLKDFVDVAFLSTKFSMAEMLEFFAEKFPRTNPIAASKAVAFFDYIDHSTPIELTKGKYNWGLISERIQKMCNEPQKVFTTYPIPQEKKKSTLHL